MRVGVSGPDDFDHLRPREHEKDQHLVNCQSRMPHLLYSSYLCSLSGRLLNRCARNSALPAKPLTIAFVIKHAALSAPTPPSNTPCSISNTQQRFEGLIVLPDQSIPLFQWVSRTDVDPLAEWALTSSLLRCDFGGPTGAQGLVIDTAERAPGNNGHGASGFHDPKNARSRVPRNSCLD